MWLALKLLFSGALEGLIKALSAAFEWLSADWRNLALAISWPALIWSQFIIVPDLRDQVAERDGRIVRVTIERDDERAAHLGTVNAFLTASKQAQKDAEANAQRVAREQERITDATVRGYLADRSRLRARADRLGAADRLRRGAARANSGNADPAGLPGVPDAAGRAAAAPDQAGLPAAGRLSLDDAVIASEQALQLDALIDWIEQQAAVPFSPADAGEPRQ